MVRAALVVQAVRVVLVDLAAAEGVLAAAVVVDVEDLAVAVRWVVLAAAVRANDTTLPLASRYSTSLTI